MEMTKKEFIEYIKQLQNFYGQQLQEIELNVWYDNLKDISLLRFNYILGEIYKNNRFMPKLAEILQINKQIPYDENLDNEGPAKDCDRCDNYGYLFYNKKINGNNYQYAAVCDCGKQKRYDGTKCKDLKNKSKYYTPTENELGFKISKQTYTKEQIIQSLNIIEKSSLISENLKNIIRSSVRNKYRSK